jgi:hypothetical protein
MIVAMWWSSSWTGVLLISSRIFASFAWRFLFFFNGVGRRAGSRVSLLFGTANIGAMRLGYANQEQEGRIWTGHCSFVPACPRGITHAPPSCAPAPTNVDIDIDRALARLGSTRP